MVLGGGVVSNERGTRVWQGFSQGLMNSMVALPLISAGVINPMTNLKGALDVHPKRAPNVESLTPNGAPAPSRTA